MMDVMGFGLLGYLSEMCEVSGLSVIVNFRQVLLFDKVILDYYLSEKCIFGGIYWNWSSYGYKIEDLFDE